MCIGSWRRQSTQAEQPPPSVRVESWQLFATVERQQLLAYVVRWRLAAHVESWQLMAQVARPTRTEETLLVYRRTTDR